MRIYLAARFSKREMVQVYAHLLESAGCTVVSRWHSRDATHAQDDGSTPEEIVRRVREDLADVDAAECILFFAEPSGSPHRGGRHVEYGYALAKGKRIIVVGERENVFHYLPEIAVAPNGWRAIAQVLQEEGASIAS